MSRPAHPRVRSQLRPFLSMLAADNPRRLAWVLGVQIAAALAQGVGLLLLVPLLEVAGVGGRGGGGTSGIVRLVRSAFGAIGLPFTLRFTLAAYVAVATAAAALGAYQSVLSTRYRLEFVDGLRRRLYATIARTEWGHLIGLRQSDLLTTLTVNVGWVAQGTLAALSLGAVVVISGVQVAVALRISPAMTGLATATGAVLATLTWPLVVRSRRLGHDLMGQNRSVLASVTGFLDGLKLAKAHGLEAGHLAGFGTTIARSRRSQIEAAKASALATAVQLTVTAVVLAILVDVAVEQLRLPLAGLLVLAFIFTRLVGQATQAQQNVQTLAQTLPAFGELMSVTADCERSADRSIDLRHPRPPPQRPALLPTHRLAFDNVSFSYQRPDGSTVAVLDCVSLEIPARTTTGLVGPSGAGKTTVADLAVGLLVPTSGRVLLDGSPLGAQDMGSWRDSVAMVPQDPFLFHDSIRANLLWAQPSAAEDEIWRALAMASAEELVRHLPDGLDTVVGDRGARLSGGERQRIALARALLRGPELLVLDEATNSLDAANEEVILDALATLHGRMTVLVISHDESMLRDADQVISIAQGRVVQEVLDRADH